MSAERIRHRLANEDGIAVAIVLGVLMIITVLTATLATVSIQSSTDSKRDRNSVQALAAAQEGVALANYRINKFHPADNQCVAGVLSAPNSGADCTYTDSTGNGGTYTYYVTQKIPAASGCATLPGTPSTGTHRCITSTGTVNGVSRRVQIRVSALPGTPPLFPVHGLIGLDYVFAKNNLDFGGADLGSNRLIDLNNNDSFGYAQLGPGASCNCGGANYSGTVNHPQPFVLQTPPIAGTESACSGAAVPGCNNNAVLSAGDGYTAGTRSLLMTHDLVLPAGDYNFCRVDFGGNDLSPAAGAAIRVFVDAPNSVRPGSGCPDNTTPPTASPMWGEFQGDNAASINAPDGNPANVLIFVYGWPPVGAFATNWGVNTITFSKNGGELDASVYAPSSVVNIAKNNGKISGGVAGWQVYVKNNFTFNWDSRLDTVGTQPGTADQKGWFECTPQPPNPNVPESGC
jgi:type II secretory pathway pseudopilin PulG